MERKATYLDPASRKAVTVGALSGIASSFITSMLAVVLAASAVMAGQGGSMMGYFFPSISGAAIGLPAALLLAAGIVVAFGFLGCIAGSAGGVLFKEFYNSLPGERTTRKAALLFLALWVVFALIPNMTASVRAPSVYSVLGPLVLCLGYILVYSYLLGVHWNNIFTDQG
ncbi:MAG: hypothetical protein SV186_05380 [Candidatus Nanohaloarchaea archaeon]|nr:hypothetical protein [Candidatus Nanohaloarchaea archaeon]